MPRVRQRAVAIFCFAAILLATAACDKIASKQAIKRGNEFFKAQKY